MEDSIYFSKIEFALSQLVQQNDFFKCKTRDNKNVFINKKNIQYICEHSPSIDVVMDRIFFTNGNYIDVQKIPIRQDDIEMKEEEENLTEELESLKREFASLKHD